MFAPGFASQYRLADVEPDAFPLLICPKCEQPVSSSRDSLSCKPCGTTYPSVGGIPVLMADADARLTRWSAQLAAFDAQMRDTVSNLATDLVDQAKTSRARQRLKSVVEGLQEHRQSIIHLFEEAGIRAAGTDPAEDGTALTAYYSLAHRDWAWPPEHDEVGPALETLAAVLPAGFALGRTLVLGAGTGRLAWALANRVAGANSVVALDVNPLPLLITRRLMLGDTLELHEFPAHPLRSDRACIKHSVRAPDSAPPSLQLLFADGLAPPVARQSIDTVITPWFVDQVPHDLAAFIPKLTEVLRPGGTWINQGPFVYDPIRTRPAHRYCGDEFVQLVSAAGFRITKCTYDAVPHMASPHSTQGRTERVLTMHAVLEGEARSVEQAKPPWLSDEGRHLPIPSFESRARNQHPTINRVAMLLNDRRSVVDLTRALIEEGLLADDGRAEVAVRGCLEVLWQRRAES